MKYIQKLTKKRTLLSLFAVTAISCGSSSQDSDVKVIGGDLIEKEDPRVNSIVLLKIEIEKKPTGMDFFRSMIFGQKIPKTAEGRCTGTVVKNPSTDAKWHVVTAAHCLQGDVTSIKIYKGSKFFGKFKNPRTKQEAIAAAHTQNPNEQEDFEAADSGFNLIATTSQFVNHPNFNGQKIDLKNRVARIKADKDSISQAIAETQWRVDMEQGLLSDLKNKTENFFEGLKNDGDRISYKNLREFVRSNIENLRSYLNRELNLLARYKAGLKRIEAFLKKALEDSEKIKNLPDDDIALLTIEEKMPSTLVPLSIANTPFKAKQKLSLLGYGVAIDMLDPAEWAHPERPEALKTLGDLKVVELDSTSINLKSKEAIFEVKNKKAGLCVGDSGGPALIKENDTYVLAGVNTQANCRDYSKITVVSEYTDWLKTHM